MHLGPSVAVGSTRVGFGRRDEVVRVPAAQGNSNDNVAGVRGSGC
jgi:hypothetical protein